MSLAQRWLHMDDVQETVSNEAKERLSSARRRDLAFAIKRVIGDRFSAEDVDMLATIVFKASDAQERITKEYIVQKLKAQGRSPQRSEELASALTK